MLTEFNSKLDTTIHVHHIFMKKCSEVKKLSHKVYFGDTKGIYSSHTKVNSSCLKICNNMI